MIQFLEFILLIFGVMKMLVGVRNQSNTEAWFGLILCALALTGLF